MRFFDAQPGIRYLGHVDRATLLVEQQRARVMAYPCTFEEGFCIAAAECMAAGAVPVTTNNYALRTTVGDSGSLVSGRPRSWFYRRAFVKAAVRLLTDDQYLACAVNRVPASCPHLGFASGRRSVPQTCHCTDARCMTGRDPAVLLVVHRREEETRRVFDAIAQARPRRLFVAGDGPASAADREACERTRLVVRQVDWDCEVAYDWSEENLGLDVRVTTAIDWVFRSADSVIVLEDDCLPHQRFFTFCTEMLDRYREDRQIMHVSGECYRAAREGDSSYLFSKYPLAWGWATWSRAWSLVRSATPHMAAVPLAARSQCVVRQRR